ncbi:MAG TPA: thiol:disulfide interchange protein DsbA/DsbL [Steroidobacteraceae bacterium]|nr:thiol:disulfide interchange protein DsbA/DsbL [Steroidobacteraceae bacterium]
MNRPIALLALLMSVCVGACGREAPRPTAPAASTPAAASAAVPAPTTAPSETPADTATHEAERDPDEPPGAASLEHLAALPPQQQLPDGRWKAGVNYDPVVPAQPTGVAQGKVEVMEVFWLGCPHCYALEPTLIAWRRSKPDYVEFVRVPVMWGPVHRAHAHLFYTLEALGRDDLVERAFDEIHAYASEAQQGTGAAPTHSPLVGNTDQETFAAQEEFAKAHGVDAQAFTTAYNSFGVGSNLQRAQEITERYHVDGVPFIIVNGKYTTDVGKAGGETELTKLIDDLAAVEHQRSHGS